MSYHKDKDRFTRGPGAIAALDGPRRHARQRALARRTNMLDRALAEYTYRPGGGIGRVSALGAINMGALGVGQGLRGGSGYLPKTDPTKPPGWLGGGGGSGASSSGYVGGATAQPTRLYGGAGTALQQGLKAGGASTNWSGPLTVTPPLPPAAVIDPVLGGGKGGSSSGGGGGGGGGAGLQTTAGGQTYPGMEPPATPDIPAEDQATGVDIKKVALVGGAAFAVWWLFFRKKSGGGAP